MIPINSKNTKLLQKLVNYNILFVSQVRLSSMDKIPGKVYHEALNWSLYFHTVIFLCFSEDEKFHYKRVKKNLIVIALPFDLSKSMAKTIIDLGKNYFRLMYYLYKIIKNFKIDLIREENLIIVGFPVFLISRITKIPFITWLGGFEREAFSLKYTKNIFSKLISSLIILLEYLIFKTSFMIFTVSEDLYNLIGKRNSKNRFLSPNYVDFSKFIEKKHIEIQKEKKIILLYSGRFEREKGIDNLLNAITILSKSKLNFELDLAGYGSMEPWIIQYIKKNNLENYVKLKGKFELSEMPKLYQSADIFIIPSYTEGLPAALLEAMCSGCACICTDVGMISQYIKDGQNGFLIKSNDFEALANKIRFLIENPEKISEFGQQTRKIIEKKSGNYLNIHAFFYNFIINNKKGIKINEK